MNAPQVPGNLRVRASHDCYQRWSGFPGWKPFLFSASGIHDAVAMLQ